MNRKFIPILNFFLFLVISFFCYSCGPKIYFFKVEPETISSEDSLKINWDVRGEPTLLVHQKSSFDDSSHKFIELTLVVQKGNDEIKEFIQVNVIPNEGSNEIIFITRVSGDTLIAAGEKNIQRWGNKYEVETIASTSDRQLIIKHFDKTAEVDANGNPSLTFKGLPIEGYWEFRALLSENERIDISEIPETLSIMVNYKYKKR